MSAVADGDVRSLRPLFQRYRDRLFTYFCRTGHDRAASEDAVQDVFLRILRSRHTFRREGHFDRWVFTIARNVQRDLAAKHWRFVPAENLDEQKAHPEPSPAQLLERRQEANLLRRALAELPADQREILILSRTSGLTYRDLGRVFECSPGALKLRVHRALKNLRRAYNNELTKEDRHGL